MNGFDELDSLNNDLADGSLDNYTESEAEAILNNAEGLSSAPFRLVISIFSLAISVLFLVGYYQKVVFEAESEEEADS